MRARRLPRLSGENTTREWMQRFSDADELQAELKREKHKREAEARRRARALAGVGRLVR